MKCKTFIPVKKTLLTAVLLLGLVLVYIPTVAFAETTITREQAVQWATDRGNEWWEINDGSGVTQCTEFVAAYYQYLTGNYRVYGNAAYYLDDNSGACLYHLGWSRPDVSEAQPGDIFIKAGNPGHVGVIIGRDGDTLTTAESNAERTNQYWGTETRNGACVIYYDRYLWDISGLIRPAFANSAPQEPSYNWNSTSAPVLPDGDYIIAAMADPHYYLDIDGAESPATPGTNVHLWYSPDGNISEYDAWTVRYENGYYRISQYGQNVSLDVDNESTANGANVQIWSNNSWSAQQWTIYGNSSVGYRVKARCSGKSLEYENSVLAGGTNVQQWADDDVPAQYWMFIPYNSPRPVVSLPSLSFEPWSDDRFTYIGETDASIGQRIVVSDGYCTEVGMILYDVYGFELGSAKNPTYENEKNYFKINEELGVTLRGGTVYQYKFYAIVNGQTVYGNMGSFTTSPSTHSHSYSRTVIYEPACEDSGYAIDECVICGLRQEVDIPALGHDYVEGICSRCGKQDPNQTRSPIAYITPSNWHNWPTEVVDTAPNSEEDQSTTFKFQMPSGIMTIWNSVSGVLGSG